MISCFFDESGTHDGSVATAMSGFSSTPEVWMVFEKRWINVLERFGLEEFHMTDFVARVHPYDGLSEEQRHDLMVSLVRCILDHDIAGTAAVLKRDDFSMVIPGVPMEGANDPYYMLMMRVMVEILLWAATRQERVMFTFDRRQKVAQLSGVLRDAIVGVYPILGKLLSEQTVFGSMREFVPLQAADLLAYETYRRGCDFSAPERRSFTALRPTFGEMTVISPAELALYSIDPRIRRAVEEILGI